MIFVTEAASYLFGNMNVGMIVVLISALGFASNWLNWHYLDYWIVRMLYYIGAFVHELSHAILCVLTGTRIERFAVFSPQPQVVHRPSRIPVIGGVLISFAPIAGGLLFLFLVNRYILGDYFFPSMAVAGVAGGTLLQFAGWHGVAGEAMRLLSRINFLEWQSWVMVLLFLNAGAMLGPSFRDLRNVWPVLVLLFFVRSAFVAYWGAFAISLIAMNIAIQAVFIVAQGIILLIKSLIAAPRAY